MPVFEWDLDLQASEWDWREAAGVLPDVCDVSEDFWRKFEELPDFGDDLESLLETAVCGSTNNNNNINDPSNVLRHHDCMWAGVCLSKEHKSLVGGTLPPPPPPPPPQPPSTPSSSSSSTTLSSPNVRQPTVTTNDSTITITAQTTNKTIITEKSKKEPRRKGVIVQKTVGRSLLINSRSRIPELTRPETPPSLSESEEDEKRTIPVVSVSEVTNQVSIRRPIHQPHQATTNINVQFDHNYDKSVRFDDLGVQTPSDSEEEEDEEEEEGVEEAEEEDDNEETNNNNNINQHQNNIEDSDDEEEDDDDEDEDDDDDDDEEEEIDVVSLNNNTNAIVRMRNQPNSLPYNPSRKLRRELQDTMASAISSNKMLSANRSVNRRLNNTSSRRKRKRGDSDDDENDNEHIVINQNQEILLNSRIMPTNNNTIVTTPIYNTTKTTSTRYQQQHHRRSWRRTSTTNPTTTKKSRFSIDSDCEKRSLHNNMERMRRIGLRNAFEDLRILVPSLKESKRAAKVNILKDSATYVRQLLSQERTLAHKVVTLRHEQEKLRTRLSKLRRSLAAHR